MTAESIMYSARKAIDYRIDDPTQERIIEALRARRIPTTPAPSFAKGGIIPKAHTTHVAVSLEFIPFVDAALAHSGDEGARDMLIAAEVLRQMPKEAAK